jgi:hypothetical protein
VHRAPQRGELRFGRALERSQRALAISHDDVFLLGRSTEVERVYQRCQTALAAHLGAAPSPESHALLTVGRLP